MSPSWVSNSYFYSSEVIENSGKVISSDSDNDLTYTNLSKMRSYLKRCESAISNISLSGKRSTQKMSESIRTKQSSSSWYIDGPETEISNKHCSELNDIENEISSVQSMSQSMHSMTENQKTNTNNEYSNNHISEIDFIRPTYQTVSMILGETKTSH